MEGSFSGAINQSDRSELAGPQMIIQQYARYPGTLDSSLQSASSAGSARSRLGASRSPPLHRKETPTPRSLQSSPRGFRSAIHQASAARTGPSMSPPLLDPLRYRQIRDSIDPAESRSLPSRNIRDETIDDAYVAFILYCNPNVPSSVDTSGLRKTFRSPPRSDGKSFSIFTLWELIRKLDNKELKTWIQLAMELGVEPPSVEKKQSTQKVQQYAVRLKRWMRAMHVDAFFEFCLGHPHNYYTQLPPLGASVSDSRDGVPLEEDLALRALVPQWKPKRGRKRTEDKGAEEEKAAKRPQLDTSVGALHQNTFAAHSVTFPQSAIPFSAFPDDLESTDPWMTAASSFLPDNPPDNQATQQSQELRWRPLYRDTSPLAHPQSAIIPRGHHPADMLVSMEPRSALTPISGDKSRAKRRHGPAVSSAWPSSNGSSTGKTRGRPPNKGSVTNGSLFSSFPANPGRTQASQLENTGPRISPVIVLEQNSPTSHAPNSKSQQSPTPFQPLNARPSKLQLQVPRHSGGPVRLATPPTLLVNGVNDASLPSQTRRDEHRDSTAPTNDRASIASGAESSSALDAHTSSWTMISTEDIIQALSTEILRGRVAGRSTPLSADEAKALAFTAVTNLEGSFPISPRPHASTFAVQLGLGHHFGLEGTTPGSVTVRVTIPTEQNLGTRVLPAAAKSQQPTATTYSISLEYRLASGTTTKVVFGDLTIRDASGGPRDSDALKVSSVTLDDGTEDLDADLEDDYATSVASEMVWKQRYLRLKTQMQKKDRALLLYKRRILESVMADI